MKNIFEIKTGKTIKQIIIDEEDYGYVVWLNDNVKSITISESDYNFCKKAIEKDSLLNNAIMDSCHENWGCRD
jgi:hypothetical protein